MHNEKHVWFFTDPEGIDMVAKPTGAWVMRYVSKLDYQVVMVEFVERHRKFLFWKLKDKTFWLADEEFMYTIQEDIS